MSRAARALLVGAGLVFAGCGNFFPNPDNVVLPSIVRDFTLTCGTLPRGECEARATKLVDQKRIEEPGHKISTVALDADGGYTITFADGSAEQMIVD